MDSLWRRSWSRRRAGRLCGCPPEVHPPFFSHLHPIIHPSSELKWSQMPRLSSFSSPDTDMVATDKRRSSQQDAPSVVLKSGAMLPPGFHLPDHSEVPESSWEDLVPSDTFSPPACPPEWPADRCQSSRRTLYFLFKPSFSTNRLVSHPTTRLPPEIPFCVGNLELLSLCLLVFPPLVSFLPPCPALPNPFIHHTCSK